MKNCVFAVSLTLFCFCTSKTDAQSIIEYETNCPRADDVIQKHQVSAFSPGDYGTNVVWDFSNIEPLGDIHELFFYEDEDSILSSISTDGVTKYEVSESGVMVTALGTSYNDITYDEPISIMPFPFKYGYSSVHNYKGSGSYCKTMIIDTSGTVSNEVDATGVIITFTGDTLKNAIRVHRTKTNSIRLHSIEDTLSSISDTISAKQDIEETYIWYARGYRYPVYETSVRTFYHDLRPVFTEEKAFCCLPDNQTLAGDSINEAIQLHDSQAVPPEIFHYSTSFNGSTLTVAYTSDEDSYINTLLCNNMGIVYANKSLRALKGESDFISFDCSGLVRGVYILYINASGIIYSETINIRQ